jgi:deoxyribose-phosphate aldolase
MKENCGPDVKIKAAGGIRTLKEAEAMLEAGASRIGSSAGIAIIEEMKEIV